MSWAGVDNIGVGILEIRADGEISVVAQVAQSNDDASLTLTITASSGDLTISSALANANVTFTPASGQTEYLESAWFTNTGHVIGVQNGAQTAANWTGSGSTCGAAFVLRETSSSITGTLAETITLGKTDALTASQVHSGTLAETKAVGKTDSLTGTQVHSGSLAEAPTIGKTDALSGIISYSGSITESKVLGKLDALLGSLVHAGTIADAYQLGKTDALTASQVHSGTLTEATHFGQDAIQAAQVYLAQLAELKAMLGVDYIASPSANLPTISPKSTAQLIATAASTARLIRTASTGAITNPSSTARKT